LHQQIQQKQEVTAQERAEKLNAYQFTQRELAIFTFYAEGKQRNEIAQLLFINENTVKSHLKSLFIKLNVQNRAQLIEKYHQIGLYKR
jgi:DNA-binding NarL/FixJ family response regulator